MKICFWFFSCVIATLVSGAIERTNDSFVHYDNYALDAASWDVPFSLVLDPAHAWAILGTERVDLHLCAAASEYVCFSSSQLVFVVPRHKVLKIGQAWSYESTSFKKLASFNYEQLGTSIMVDRIRATPKIGVTTDFLYSCEVGLIAIDEISKEDKHVDHYVLREKFGFGAQNCPEKGT